MPKNDAGFVFLLFQNFHLSSPTVIDHDKSTKLSYILAGHRWISGLVDDDREHALGLTVLF